MAVYSYRILSDIEYYTKQLAEMFFERTKLVITPDEFIAAYINPEHIGILRDAQGLVGFVGNSSTHTVYQSTGGTRYGAYLAFVGNPPIIMPQYVSQGLQPTCPDDVRAKITGWIDERERMGEAFGDVLDALHLLNDECGDAAAMRVMLPCLPTVMASMVSSEDDVRTKRAKRIAESKRFGALPRLAQSAKQRLLEVSAMVNAAAMVKDAPTTTAPIKHAAVSQVTPSRGTPGRPSPLYAGRDVVKTASFV